MSEIEPIQCELLFVALPELSPDHNYNILSYNLISHTGITYTTIACIPFIQWPDPTKLFVSARSALHQIKRIAKQLNLEINNLEQYEPRCPKCHSFSIDTHQYPEPTCLACGHLVNFLSFKKEV